MWKSLIHSFIHSINLKKNQVLPKAKVKKSEERDKMQNCLLFPRNYDNIDHMQHARAHTHTYIQEQNKRHLYAFYDLKGSLK